MFSIRKRIGSGFHWGRSFLSQLGTDLSMAGFTKITVKLPIDLSVIVKESLPIEERIESELRKREINFQDFLDRERNYPAVILIAVNNERQETLKILFVNTSKKTSFTDTTFPSGHSVPSQIYVQSPDPARVYSLSHFFYEYLRKQTDSTVLLTIAGIVAMFLTAAQTISYIGGRRGLLQVVWGWHSFFDIALIILLLIVQYNSFKAPRGLSVNERDTQTAQSLIVRAMRGELRDNPIVNIIVGVVASILSAIILRLVGWP